ncbi:hypothetical protein [Gottfriedia luciferensis]|uniref:hypothetical protein n=1 Tax=Gottfriedia luciferensis TaxID=178774 RepID=UPI000B441601|nr:hypothetical protein [Gottfriedia luciferensis]
MKEFYSNEQVYLSDGMVPSVYSLCIDCERKIVHVLDLARIGTRPVIVSFSNKFAEYIFERLNNIKPGSYLDYKYLIYSTEGIVSIWINNQLIQLPNLDHCKQEYVHIMKERKKYWPKYMDLYNRK